MTPRLTIGIPTHDRPEMLVRAVRSALAQTVPVRVLVSDDNPSADTTSVLLKTFGPDVSLAWYLDEPCRIVHRYSHTKGLWANWDACARACDTDFFLWLQDDDVILPHLAERVIAAFDRFPAADTYMAPLKLALDERHHWWNNGNGPWVPLSVQGIPDQWEAEIFAPTCYFLAWSLSPGVAFRCGPRFTAALDWMPMDCDVFAERLILVGMGTGGRFVADPAVAGLWIQHADNQYRKSHADQPRQSKILISKLDEVMDRLGDRWREVLGLWCKLQHPHWIAGWLGDLAHVQREGGKSRYGRAIRDVLLESLRGRVEFVPRYRWWRRVLNRIGRAAMGI